MIDLMAYYWQGITAIFLVSAFSSYVSSKLGLFISFLMTLGAAAFAIMLVTVPTGGGYTILIVGFILFPSITWIGFFIGRFLRKQCQKNA